MINNTIANLIEENYLFPTKAKEIATFIRTLEINADEDTFAEQLTRALIEFAEDEHLLLQYAPEQIAEQQDHEAIMREHTARARSRNFGFETVQHLADNIGYWKLNELPPVFIAGKMVDAAITLLENTNAIILDMQTCEGGAADMVQYIASVFLKEELALSGIESRKHGLQEVKTLPEMTCTRLTEKPLMILIGEATFSAAEALAYDLQAHKRATIIGRRSRGGAHLSDFFPIDNTWLLRIPVARALNPITQGNWEGRGVIPDFVSETPRQTAIEHFVSGY